VRKSRNYWTEWQEYEECIERKGKEGDECMQSECEECIERKNDESGECLEGMVRKGRNIWKLLVRKVMRLWRSSEGKAMNVWKER
jgi:hypothetical protein